MSMKRYILSALLFTASMNMLLAQDDVKAKGILDEVSTLR